MDTSELGDRLKSCPGPSSRPRWGAEVGGAWVGLGMDFGSFLPSPAWALRPTTRVAGKQHPPGVSLADLQRCPLTSLDTLLPASLGPGPHFHEVVSTQPETRELQQSWPCLQGLLPRELPGCTRPQGTQGVGTVAE